MPAPRFCGRDSTLRACKGFDGDPEGSEAIRSV